MKYAVRSRESKQEYEYFDSLDEAKRQAFEHRYEDAAVGAFDERSYKIYKVIEGSFEEVNV
jgi:hypothetical protein